MHYMTAGVLMSLLIRSMNCLSEKFMGSQDNEQVIQWGRILCLLGFNDST